MNLLFRTLISTVPVLFLAMPLFAQTTGAKIEKILIEGNRRIEESAVRAKISTQVGEKVSPEKIRKDIQGIFEMGFFENVVVTADPSAGGLTVKYALTEKPTMTGFIFDGNDEVDDADLQEVMALKPFEILDMSKVQKSVEQMLKLYEEKGYFLARVDYRIVADTENKEPGAVKLVFKIIENDQVKVAKIRFLGNEKIPSSKLKSAMQTQEGGFFSFISGSGSYKQEAFERDIQALYYLVYYNEGYIQAKIDRPQVYVTPDKRRIHITIRVDEGEQFKVGEVNFAGDLLFKDQELFEAISLKAGELFVYSTMQNDLSALQAKYGDLGYAYANIIPRTRIRERDRLVDITFEIDKGNKVYINRINVVGNTKTRDKVLRREMRIQEGELYHETRKRESLANIKRLGFFDEVIFNTKTPAGRNDLMDIDIVVKERNTGQIQLGAGYSNYGGFLLNGQVNQTNLFGKGQKLGVSIDYSRAQQLYSTNFTEPYFMDTEWSVGGEAYFRKRENEQSDYSEKRYGTSFRVGHPLAPYLEGSVGYKIDDTHLTLNENGDPDLFPVETVNGVTSAAILALVYDKRDDRFAPTDGMFTSLSLEYAGLGGDLDYTKGLANFRYYKNIFWDVIWRNNISYGVVASNDGDRAVPFNQLFLLGGANSLRGYEWFQIGKRKYSDKAFQRHITSPDRDKLALMPFGGKQQLFYNLEFQFPLINEAGIKGVVFYDIGYADDSLDLSDFRSNVGFGFRWFSPIGPLRFEWGFPFEREEVYGERSVNFEFAIGTPF